MDASDNLMKRSTNRNASTPFPKPIMVGERLYFDRYKLESYKRALAGDPPPVKRDVVEWVPASKVAKELGVSRRTIGRLMAKMKTNASE